MDGRFILNQLNIRHFSGDFSWILDREITLGKAVSYNFKVLLREAEILNEVVFHWKNIKTDNPALRF
jgi:hypothetical protein